MRLRLAGVAALLALAGCTSKVPARAPETRCPDVPKTTRIVLVTVDGVRWQEVFGGLDRARAAEAGVPLGGGETRGGETRGGETRGGETGEALFPTLHRLAKTGVLLGAPGKGLVEASGPFFVSQPGYQEIFAGTSTGCRSNNCGPTPRATMLDALAARFAFGEVASIGSWEQLEQAVAKDPGKLVVSVGRKGGKTRAEVGVDDRAREVLRAAEDVPPYPGNGDYRQDVATAELALRYLRAKRPRFLHVGLGDPDEWAHRMDYAAYVRSLRDTDRFLAELERTLAEDPTGRETTVLVTADHGRNDDFGSHGRGAESSRVFLAAWGGAVPARGAVATEETIHLADVAPTILGLLGLPASRALAPLLPDDGGLCSKAPGK